MTHNPNIMWYHIMANQDKKWNIYGINEHPHITHVMAWYSRDEWTDMNPITSYES